jgi:hypothetical protein
MKHLVCLMALLLCAFSSVLAACGGTCAPVPCPPGAGTCTCESNGTEALLDALLRATEGDAGPDAPPSDAR